MSEPKRYDPPNYIEDSGFMELATEGEFVRYEDYARLKAEVERLEKVTTLSNSPTWNAIGAYAEAKEEVKQLKAQVKKLTEAGNAMDNAISEIDPQRLERHRFMRMTDAEYLAVMKWRVAKDPNYNRA